MGPRRGSHSLRFAAFREQSVRRTTTPLKPRRSPEACSLGALPWMYSQRDRLLSTTIRSSGSLGTFTGRRALGSRPAQRSDTTAAWSQTRPTRRSSGQRSEEHTSELQSHVNLVCRLLLEKKKKKKKKIMNYKKKKKIKCNK